MPWNRYEAGWKVAACQLFQPGRGLSVLVDDPMRDRLYEFQEANVFMEHKFNRREMNGLRGHFGPEKKKIIVSEDVTNLDEGWVQYDPYQCLEWYHFAGIPDQLLGELKKSSHPAKEIFGQDNHSR